jgi:sugar lactone lactonase YvrE
MPSAPLVRTTRTAIAGAIAALALGGCPQRPHLPTYVAAPRGALSAAGMGIEPGDWSAPGAVGVDAAGGVRLLAKHPSTGHARSPFRSEAYQVLRIPEAGEPAPVSPDLLADANLTPLAIARDPQGNLLIAHANHQLHRWTLPGRSRLVAGGLRGQADGEGPEARFDQPNALAVAPDGTAYVADRAGSALRRVAPDGRVDTLSLDAALGEVKVSDLAVGADGALYVADARGRVLRWSGGATTVVAGSTTADSSTLVQPRAIAIGPDGAVYVADDVNRIRRIASDGPITTVAGGHEKNGHVDGPAESARLGTLGGIAVDAAGNVFVSDQSAGRVRRVAPDGTVSTHAGQTVSKVGLGREISNLERPTDLTIGPDGTLHVVTEYGLRTVRPDRGVADVALRAEPAEAQPAADMVVDADGTAYVSDPTAGLVWRVGPDGRIVAYAGDHAFFKQAGRQVGLQQPSGLALDAQGALLIADAGNGQLVRLAPGVPAAVLASNLEGVTDLAALPDGGVLATTKSPQDYAHRTWHLASGATAAEPWAPAQSLDYPLAVTTTRDGMAFINDSNSRIWRYDRAGASSEVLRLSQEDPAALKDKGYTVLLSPSPPEPTARFGAMTVDPSGRLVVVDIGLDRLLRLAGW